MPLWTLQKYENVPVFVNLTVIGLVLNGRPESTACLPVVAERLAEGPVE